MTASAKMIRIPYDAMLQEFERIIQEVGFPPERAKIIAEIFANNSRDGVASHGYNRILFFANTVQSGDVNVQTEAEPVASFGAWEQWDGQLGAGMLNAMKCTQRVMDLARENGLGCVALRNTNHWMRPGYYGWQAAEAGFIFMCWTNTIPNMPPWGGAEPRIGNNPIVLAVPRESGPVVLDIAMSQFAFGRLELYSLRNQELPVPGGYDEQGKLTRDAQAIIDAERPLPIGYWKGSGLSLMLDLIGALLSGGKTSQQIGLHDREFGVSQTYLAFDINRAADNAYIDRIVTATLAYLQSAETMPGHDSIRYPGERILQARADSLQNGIAVDESLWQEISQF